MRKKRESIKNILRRVLPDGDKMEFVKTAVSWIESRDIMDTCFVLNFGYEAPLPWPQVLPHNIYIYLHRFDIFRLE